MAGIKGILDNWFGGNEAAKGSEMQEQVLRELEELGKSAPTAQDLSVQYMTPDYAGDVEAAQMQAAQVGPSAMEGVATDPRLAAAQMQALEGLQDISSQGGLTATDRARLDQISRDEATQARGAREAILQNARQRGVGGSGIELLSSMVNQQQSANRQAQRDLGVEALAEERALNALMQAGQLGGQIRGQEFGEKSAKAQSMDAIAKFNAGNTQQAAQFNAGLNQQANINNQGAQQNFLNRGADIKNKERDQNAGAKQQAFGNQAGIAGMKSGQTNKIADTMRDSSDQSIGIAGDLFSTAGKFGASMLSDRNVKKDIEEFDAGAFLDQLVPSKYKYKDPSDGPGEQVGVMAQDLEKGAPQMVQDTPEGKVVDYNKAGGPLFASLANLNKRLRKIEGGE